MTNLNSPYLIYFASMLVIWLVYLLMRNPKQVRHQKLLRQVVKNNLAEPVSLHPVINTNRCIGCQACIYACPEREYGPVLGLIQGKAALIKASECIGHGACYAACPVDAITLVFGTERRGVDIPHVKTNFETNVPGIFIAGELGGMGLVRNAFNQGVQAINAIQTQVKRQKKTSGLDVLIVGAGPAGIAASLAATEKGLNFATVEQESLGGSILHYPRDKIVMDAPVNLPVVGKLDLRNSTKQDFLERLQAIIEQTGLPIAFNEKVTAIKPLGQIAAGFSIVTNKKTYTAKTVLLAIGRRGSPRHLNIPGEESAKVAYKLNDAVQYRGKRVLIVGGGDSALEAADVLSDQPGTQVTLVYRGTTFMRAKESNRAKISKKVHNNQLTILYRSMVTKIENSCVKIEQDGRSIEITNEAVLLCTGGELPIPFLRQIGVDLETRYGTPL